MNPDRNELDREDSSPLAALFEQHPEPWIADDAKEGHEGMMTVFDAAGKPITCTGDMEACGIDDIELAYGIAALPDLIALAQSVAKEYPDAADWKDARPSLYALANDILQEVRR